MKCTLEYIMLIKKILTWFISVDICLLYSEITFTYDPSKAMKQENVNMFIKWSVRYFLRAPCFDRLILHAEDLLDYYWNKTNVSIFANSFLLRQLSLDDGNVMMRS
jgi:hypothetical protein